MAGGPAMLAKYAMEETTLTRAAGSGPLSAAADVADADAATVADSLVASYGGRRPPTA